MEASKLHCSHVMIYCKGPFVGVFVICYIYIPYTMLDSIHMHGVYSP